MSSMIAWFSKNKCWVATDTFSHVKSKEHHIIPINYISKTCYLPQFKMCFCVQGSALILNEFFLFAQQRIIAKNIKGVVKATKEGFKIAKTKEIPNGLLNGTIFLFGYDEDADQFACIKLIVTNGHPTRAVEMPDDVLIMKPEITNYEQIVGSSGTEFEIATNLMNEQKRLDETKPHKERVGIGGQVQFTDLINPKEYSGALFQISMIHNFEDFELSASQIFQIQ